MGRNAYEISSKLYAWPTTMIELSCINERERVTKSEEYPQNKSPIILVTAMQGIDSAKQ